MQIKYRIYFTNQNKIIRFSRDYPAIATLQPDDQINEKSENLFGPIPANNHNGMEIMSENKN